MTNEDLDAARVEEAERRFVDPGRSGLDDADWGRHVALIAARLARENWQPTDPDLVLAREVANACEGLVPFFERERIALAAIRAARGEAG